MHFRSCCSLHFFLIELSEKHDFKTKHLVNAIYSMLDAANRRVHNKQRRGIKYLHELAFTQSPNGNGSAFTLMICSAAVPFDTNETIWLP